MKKSLVAICLILVLAACQVQSIQETRISNSLESFQRQGTSIQNIVTPSYSFYRPFHVGVYQSGAYFMALKSYDEIIMLNVDVVGVIAKNVYVTTLNRSLRTITLDPPLIHIIGEFDNIQSQTQTYELKITRYEERYSLMLRSFNIVLTANVALANVESVLADMIVILKSSTVDDERIMTLYANIEKRADLQVQSENLFNQLAPESGTIADMINLLKGPPTLEELLREYQLLPEEPIIEGDEEDFDQTP
jgi:hypothetical protein